MSNYPQTQYSIFRILFGIWLIYYFSSFFPQSSFYFSNIGAFPDQFFPNIFNLFNSPLQVKALLLIFILSAILFTLGIFRRANAFILWFGWASLLGRIPIYYTPIDGYVGWLLLASVIIPPQNENWKMPKEIYYGAWIVFALSYTFSGFIKLSSPSWIQGETLAILFNGPLIRPWPIFATKLPDSLLMLGTWITLLFELLFFPLFLFKKLRPYLWWAMTFFHLGILFTLNFGDLSLVMLLSQLFILNEKWFPKFKRELALPL